MHLLEDIHVSIIKAEEIVGTGFPTDEGERFAILLLENKQFNWTEDVIDLRGCDSGLLISAFFNAFLQTVHNQNPRLLPLAREIHWELEFDFQQEHVANWMKDFKPESLQAR